MPAILFSPSDERIVEGYKLGADSYVTEPADFGKFSEVIQYLRWCWLNSNESP